MRPRLAPVAVLVGVGCLAAAGLSSCSRQAAGADIAALKRATWPEDAESWKVADLQPSVALVTVDLPDGGHAFGHGVVISPAGDVLTAMHGAQMAHWDAGVHYDSASTVQMGPGARRTAPRSGEPLHCSVTVAGRSYPHVLFIAHLGNDVALVQVQGLHPSSCARLEDLHPTGPVRVVVMGCDQHFAIAPAFGISDSSGPLWSVRLPGMAGDSGSPVFTKDHVCIAMLVACSFQGMEEGNPADGALVEPIDAAMIADIRKDQMTR